MSAPTLPEQDLTSDNGTLDVPEQVDTTPEQAAQLPPAYSWATRVSEDDQGRVQSRDASTPVAITHTDTPETALPTLVTMGAVDVVDENGMRRLGTQITIVVDPDNVTMSHGYEPLNFSVEQARSLRDALDELITASTADKLFAPPLPHCPAWCGDIHSEHDYDHVGGTWHHDLVVDRIGTQGNDMAADRDAGFELGVCRDDDIGDRAYLAIEGGDCCELSLENVEHFRDAFAAAAALLKGGVQGGLRW